MRGHLYIINGDAGSVTCDAWLLPSDPAFNITRSFCAHVGMSGPGRLPNPPSAGFNQRCCLLYRGAVDDQPDLWIGDVGRQGAPVTHYSAVARDFVESAATEVRHRIGSDSVPLLALPVIGSGNGGRRWSRGPLLRELIPALQAAADEFAADVILVTHGLVMHSAAQVVRRETVPEDIAWADLDEGLRLTAVQIGAHAKQGNLVLFMGAGVSRGAGVPVWKELLEQIARDLGLDDEFIASMSHLDPRDQATILMKQDEARFPKVVRDAMSKECYSLTHGLLASLPVKEYVTTNFDELFEKASRIDGRSIAVIPDEQIEIGQRWLLKLHGTIGKKLVFTRSEYIDSMSRNSALRGLVQAMLLTRHMLFVGYSLSDDDFHQLMHEVRLATGASENAIMGTVLTFDSGQHARALWGELDFVSMENSVRRLQIFLDRVGAEASSPIAFVLDETIGDIGGEDEVELAEILSRLDSLVERNSSWSEVRSFLDRLRSS